MQNGRPSFRTATRVLRHELIRPPGVTYSEVLGLEEATTDPPGVTYSDSLGLGIFPKDRLGRREQSWAPKGPIRNVD